MQSKFETNSITFSEPFNFPLFAINSEKAII